MSPANDRGVTLVTALFVVMLVTSLAIFVHFQVVAQWKMAANVESQLYSLILAENGIEYARTILPHLDLTSLLRGADGVHSGTAAPEWRSPMPFKQARNVDPAAWKAGCDDGMPLYGSQLLLPNGYAAKGGGYFFLRFSNNPEESADRDDDHTVLVRSLGVVPSRLRDPFLPAITNDVSLVEASFRQEVAFLLPSALTLFGDSGNFQWQGESFTVNANDEFAVSVISFSQPGLQQSFLDSLSVEQQSRIQGHEVLPSVQDATDLYSTKGIYQVLFRSGFWRHFEGQLPSFVDQGTPGLRYLPEGGLLESPFSGILMARGNLTLAGQASLQGLLLHLGGGQLVIQDNARITGGVWLSNLDYSTTSFKSLPLYLSVGGSTEILYSAAAIRRALNYFPPTQLGWRILFPEIIQ